MDIYIYRIIQILIKLLLLPSYIVIKFIADSIKTIIDKIKNWILKEAEVVDPLEERKMQVFFFMILLYATYKIVWFYFPNAFHDVSVWGLLKKTIRYIARKGEADPVTAQMYAQQFISNTKLSINWVKNWFLNTWILSLIFLIIDKKHLQYKVEDEKKALDDGGRLSQEEREELRQEAIADDKFYVGSLMEVEEEDKQEFEDIITRKTKPKYKKHLFLSPKDLSLHAQVVGGTGTGKTASIITPLSMQQFRAGYGGIIVDAKGDKEFYENLKAYLDKYDIDRPFRHINLADKDGSDKYNPLLTGDIQEIQGRLMQSYKWSDEYYKSAASNNLLTILQAMDIVGITFTYNEIYRYMSNYELLAGVRNDDGEKIELGLVDKIPKKDKYENVLMDLREIINNWSNHLQDTNGLRNNLKLTSHAIGKVGNTKESDIDIAQAYQNNEIVYVTLPTNMYEEHARAIGRILLLDLKATANAIDLDRVKGEKEPFFIHIDEASEFVSEPLVGFLNKARSSKMSISIYHQSIADMKTLGDEIADQIGENSTLKMIFRVNNYDTAEKIADDIGTTERVTDNQNVLRSNTGEKRKGKNKQKEKEHIVDTNILLNANHKFGLTTGQAVITSPYPDFFCYIVNTDFLPIIVDKSGNAIKLEDSKTLDKIKNQLKKVWQKTVNKLGKFGFKVVEKILSEEKAEKENREINNNQNKLNKDEQITSKNNNSNQNQEDNSYNISQNQDNSSKKAEDTQDKKQSTKQSNLEDNILDFEEYEELLEIAMKEEVNNFLAQEKISKNLHQHIKNNDKAS